jgi:hypothetical protein
LLDTFPQLQTIPRVDFIRGSSERGGPRAAHAKPPTLLRDNIRLYEAPLPVAQSETRSSTETGTHKSKAKSAWSIYPHSLPLCLFLAFLLSGVHHSKMVISIYDHGCRVAVCTANFIQVDWIWSAASPALSSKGGVLCDDVSLTSCALSCVCLSHAILCSLLVIRFRPSGRTT